MDKTLISQTYWLSIDQDRRNKLARLFDIRRSGFVMVENRGGVGRVVSDGYTNEDLAAISLWKMQKMLNTQEQDFYALLNYVLAKIDELIAIKNSGVVDSEWNMLSDKALVAVAPHEEETEREYVASEDIAEGEHVRIRDGHIYKVSARRGVAKKKHGKKAAEGEEGEQE